MGESKGPARNKGIRESSQCLRESEAPARNEGVRGSSQGLSESEAPARAPVRFLGSQKLKS